MCHLLTGILIGMPLSGYFRDRHIVTACAVGALLPDLIDKPLGHFLLDGGIGSGRIYAHGIFFFLALLLIGILIWRKNQSFFIIALSFGVLSHQALDLMWQIPENWFYPLLGPYRRTEYPDFFWAAITAELTSISEWMFFSASAVTLSLHYRDSLEQVLRPGIWHRLRTLHAAVIPALAGMGGYALCAWMVSAPSHLMANESPEANLLLGLASVSGAVLILGQHRSLAKQTDAELNGVR